jgi:hypothetical protein
MAIPLFLLYEAGCAAVVIWRFVPPDKWRRALWLIQWSSNFVGVQVVKFGRQVIFKCRDLPNVLYSLKCLRDGRVTLAEIHPTTKQILQKCHTTLQDPTTFGRMYSELIELVRAHHFIGSARP